MCLVYAPNKFQYKTRYSIQYNPLLYHKSRTMKSEIEASLAVMSHRGCNRKEIMTLMRNLHVRQKNNEEAFHDERFATVQVR